VKISGQGQVGVATFYYRRIGGAFAPGYVFGGVTSAAFAVPGMPTPLSFVNDATANPTFIGGDIFAVSSPGGPILEQGRDQETAPALVARCQDRWPALSDIPTPGKYRQWAFAADRQVTKVGVVADLLISNQVLVTIGGQVNPLVGSVIANVQKFIDIRLGITEIAIVTTASVLAVDISGYVTVPVGQSTAVKAAADQMWQDYIAGLDVAGTAKVSELQRILGDAVKSVVGATAQYDVLNLAIVGANAAAPPLTAPNVNLTASASQVLQIAVGADGASRVPRVALAWYEA